MVVVLARPAVLPVWEGDWDILSCTRWSLVLPARGMAVVAPVPEEVLSAAEVVDAAAAAAAALPSDAVQVRQSHDGNDSLVDHKHCEGSRPDKERAEIEICSNRRPYQYYAVVDSRKDLVGE